MKVLALLALAPLTWALQDPAPPAADARTGRFRVSFEARHPLGELPVQAKRLRWPRGLVEETDPEGRGEYEPADASFEVFVPEAYAEREGSWGLLVWVSPGGIGHVPREWEGVLAEHRLIAIGPNDAGNERYVWYRIGLALDAAHGMGERYELDGRRVYVAGFSGGGRLATRLGLLWPDVFEGGIYMGGSTFWEEMPTTSDPSLRWPARIPKPTGKLLKRARLESRHVLFVGEDDFNREQSRAIYERLAGKERFRHVAWIEQEGAGHVYADAEHLARAIEALDAPLEAEGED